MILGLGPELPSQLLVCMQEVLISLAALGVSQDGSCI